MQQLSFTQRELLNTYKNKWLNQFFDNKDTNQSQIVEAIRLAYQLMNLNLPQIIFCQNPYQLSIRDEFSSLELLEQTISSQLNQLVFNELQKNYLKL